MIVPLSAPQPFESLRRQLGVFHHVLDASVPEVGLNGPSVDTHFGQIVATGVPQQLGVHRDEIGQPARPGNEYVDRGQKAAASNPTSLTIRRPSSLLAAYA